MMKMKGHNDREFRKVIRTNFIQPSRRIYEVSIIL